jgi:hypothetical protein
MKIIKNTSKYDTKKLRQLFCFIHFLIAKKEGRLKHWKHLKIQIRNSGRRNSGCAYIGQVWGASRDMFLSLHHNFRLDDVSDLFAHELMHSYGFHHRDMLNVYTPLVKEQHQKIKDKFGNVDFTKIEKPKVKVDYIVIRKTKAEKNLAKWLSKYSFAKNKVKKYQRQVKYYN